MENPSILLEPLLKRMFVRFVLLGLFPTILLLTVPIAFPFVYSTEQSDNALLIVWATQSATFLIVLLFGARESLKQLAIPIQELITAADTITDGNLSYRVSTQTGNQELDHLAQTFNKMAEAVEAMRNNIEIERDTVQNRLDTRELEFTAMLEISSLVNNHADLPTTAEQALRIAHNVLGSDMIALLLHEPNNQMASTVFCCKDCPHDYPRRCRPCGRRPIIYRAIGQLKGNMMQTAMESQKPLFVPDLHDPTAPVPASAIPFFDQLKIGRICVSPLLTGDHASAILVLMRYDKGPVPEGQRRLGEALYENIAVLLENWHLKNQVRTLTIMDERRRLAGELHDSVTQSLFTLSLTTRGLKSQLQGSPGTHQKAIDVLIDQTRIMQIELRALINELRPVELDADGLENALRRHVQSLHHSSTINAKLQVSGHIGALPIPIQQNLNRIAQEGLSNIVRHSNAANAEVRLSITQDYVTMTIWDDGIGFNVRSVALQPGSLGLISMRERVEMLGGALILRSQPMKETTITVQIPLNPAQELVDVRL